jgi:DNA-binding winged helix-turn-helix (wHTH) protein/tetratricopeptide (TPR) repeat protein
MNRPEKPIWEFGSFRLDTTQRLLFRHGELVALSRKAVEILSLLIDHQGQLVEKEEIMRRVWPDAFVEESNLAVHISQLRKTLGDEDVCRIETIPRRGYRFVGSVQARAQSEAPGAATAEIQDSARTETPLHTFEAQAGASPAAESVALAARKTWRGRRGWVVAGVAVVLISGVAVFSLRHRWGKAAGPGRQTEGVSGSAARKYGVVLGEISNNTGDPVFEVTLREAVAIELEQSPYVSLIPEARLQQSLKLMGKAGDARMTPDLSREICQRNGGEAVIDGWIAKLGSQFVLGLRAINCRTGDHFSDLQTTAASKELVLKAVGDATGQLRTKLGESLSTVQKFDTPIEEATTSSLEALQAYSLGRQTMVQKGESAPGIPFFQKAIRLDPAFAVAYAALGNAYSNLGETGQAAANTRKAYELRTHVSEHERLYIESHFYQFVIGDLVKASQVYETWAATYPNDEAPRTNLAAIYSGMGNFDRSLELAKEAVSISSHDGQTDANLVNAYISLNKPDQASAVAKQAQSENHDSSALRLYLYDAAYLQHDTAEMQKQLNWGSGEPGVEDAFLDDEANVAASIGQLHRARAMSDRAVEAAKRAEENETAASYELNEAEREALFGNEAEGRKAAEAALSLAKDRDTRYGAAITFALSGDVGRATAIAGQLDKDFPNDTFVQFLFLPTIRGAVALREGSSDRAVQALEPASEYELGVESGLLPVYVRGLAFLKAGDGHKAAAEFQKIIDHPGVVLNAPIGPLSKLQIARAFVVQGDLAKAKSAYEDFLNRWKGADAEIPIFEQAQKEYSARWGAQN